MSEVSQPNEQLIETIEKALEAATPGPWEVDEYQKVLSPHTYYCVRGDEEGWDIGVDTAKKEDAHLIANAPEWLRALLEENKRLNMRLETMAEKAAESFEMAVESARELEQTREELEQLREDRHQNAADMFHGLYIELEQVKAERDDYRRVLQFSSSLDARSILSQYGDTHE